MLTWQDKLPRQVDLPKTLCLHGKINLDDDTIDFKCNGDGVHAPSMIADLTCISILRSSSSPINSGLLDREKTWN